MLAAGNRERNTLSLWDRRTGRTYLVDSGADVCVIPANRHDKLTRRVTAPLVAANGSTIQTWGTQTEPLDFGGQRSFHHDFYIADVNQPILGADFFIKNHLAIDLRGRRLIDLENGSALAARVTDTPVTVAGLCTDQSNPFLRIM